ILKQNIDHNQSTMPRCAGLTLRQSPDHLTDNKVASQLFKKKSPELLMREAEAPERKMKRALTAFDLTCLGIGAIIGAGIFALAGTAAAGEQAQAVSSIWKTPVLNFIESYVRHTELVFGRPGAGPAVVF